MYFAKFWFKEWKRDVQSSTCCFSDGVRVCVVYVRFEWLEVMNGVNSGKLGLGAKTSLGLNTFRRDNLVCNEMKHTDLTLTLNLTLNLTLTRTRNMARQAK